MAIFLVVLAYVIESLTFLGSNLFFASAFEEIIKLIIILIAMLILFKSSHLSVSFSTGLIFLFVESILFIIGYESPVITFKRMLLIQLFYTFLLHVSTAMVLGYGVKLYRDNKYAIAILLALVIVVCFHLIFNLLGYSLPITPELFMI